MAMGETDKKLVAMDVSHGCKLVNTSRGEAKFLQAFMATNGEAEGG